MALLHALRLARMFMIVAARGRFRRLTFVREKVEIPDRLASSARFSEPGIRWVVRALTWTDAAT